MVARGAPAPSATRHNANYRRFLVRFCRPAADFIIFVAVCAIFMAAVFVSSLKASYNTTEGFLAFQVFIMLGVPTITAAVVQYVISRKAQRPSFSLWTRVGVFALFAPLCAALLLMAIAQWSSS
jgi:hypothetical protein